MELNAKGRYAVMAMADLAVHAGVSTVPLNDIAERQHLSAAFLEQIFVKLRRADLLVSERGRSGGYRLARPAGRIAVADIMSAVEEGVEMTRCSGEGVTGCVRNERCLTHGLWQALSDHIRSFLDEVTLQDVVDGRIGSPRREAAE